MTITRSHTTRTANTLRRLYPNVQTWTERGVTYRFQLTRDKGFLYGKPIALDSLIPRGRVMALRNSAGETLTLRGEQHGDRIAFFDVCGEGGTREIGAWVKVEGA